MECYKSPHYIRLAWWSFALPFIQFSQIKIQMVISHLQGGLCGLVVCKFGIWSHALIYIWVQLTQAVMLRTCPKMTLHVEPERKTYAFDWILTLWDGLSLSPLSLSPLILGQSLCHLWLFPRTGLSNLRWKQSILCQTCSLLEQTE